MNQQENDAGLATAPGYRYANLLGDQLLVAGQVPRDRSVDLVGAADPAVPATSCLDNLRTLRNVHDFAEADIRRVIVYVVGEHQNLLDAWSTVTEWFAGDVPPATLGVHLLGHSAQLVEIDATVVRRAA